MIHNHSHPDERYVFWLVLQISIIKGVMEVTQCFTCQFFTAMKFLSKRRIGQQPSTKHQSRGFGVAFHQMAAVFGREQIAVVNHRNLRFRQRMRIGLMTGDPFVKLVSCARMNDDFTGGIDGKHIPDIFPFFFAFKANSRFDGNGYGTGREYVIQK